ncbi:hypothetical protein ACSBR1_018576 [Camellia fascicularis]
MPSLAICVLGRMGCQTPMSSEHLRAYWTPAMECYFIDLMLDHMHRGNRVGHTFNKQAWVDMLSMFSAKFGTQHDKDILKNRYSTLWKQFNDVKNVLDQSGFSWDDTQQMVVAEDYVWDTYTKAHSDAQYYRNKPLMNFSDLCLIYAYATADGRYSRSSHDIDFDDEIQGLNIGEGKEAQAPSFSNCTRTYWTLPMDHYLIDLLLDQVLRGNKIGHAFITQAWNEMVKSFNSKFGSHYDKEVLKSRYKHLREQYNDLKILLDHNGFSWDETQEMVTAEEYVLDSYTKEGSNGKPSNMAHSEDLDDSDCSRTDWTPSMDRCLIDLLLKQVHKGQIINHIFDEQVWIDIVAAFNDRFGSQHDKYVLKGQYKSLKKLYHDMKNLLELGEFSWDESRQMVTGPDDVWDAYTKNPDGTSFSTKTMPNYNDLCLVYGNWTSEGRRNQSDPYVGFNGDGRDFQASQNGSCLRSGWTGPMDRYFIDLMLEQIRKGNMIDQNFNKQAWGDMMAKFVAKFGSQHHKDVLESRFEKMRNLFHDMRTLVDQSGFAWDEMQQMLTASDDIWDAYIKEDDQSSSGSDTSSIAWTKPMDRYFIDLMLGQVFEGNRVENTFNKQAWVCMITSFNEKFGLQFDKCVLENRYLSLMKQYDGISTLLNKNGFAWDEIEQKITADDDYWEAYIEEHPDAVAYKDIILENYCDLSIIFGDEIHDRTSSYLCPEMNIDDNALEMGMDGIFGALKSPARDNEVSNGRKRRQSTTLLSSTRGRKIKKTREEELQEAGRSNTVDRNYSSIESIVDALQAVPDMHDELFFGCFEGVCEDGHPASKEVVVAKSPY